MIDDEMIASYSVEVTGFKRTEAEMKKLGGAIRLLRQATYNSGGKQAVSHIALGGEKVGAEDIFVTKLKVIEGRVTSSVQRVMAGAMAEGRRHQATALRVAETPTGKSGRPKGRKGPGREVSGKLINAIKTNVETGVLPNSTFITGWHGWPKDDRKPYFAYQEQGTRGRPSAQHADSLKRRVKKRNVKRLGPHPDNSDGIQAVNSLGLSIITVRAKLQRELKGIK